MFADPQVRHLGIAQPVGGTRVVGQPVELSRTPSRAATPTPGPGEHTDEILHEFGFTAAEIAAARAAKAI